MSVSHLYIFFVKMFKSSAHLLLFCIELTVVWEVYMFWKVTPLCCIICKYFLPFYKLSFYFIDSFLYCAKTFELDGIPPFIFYFIYLGFALKDWSKKRLLPFMSRNVLPMEFMVSCLFIILHMTVQLSLYRLLKRLFCLLYILDFFVVY